MGVYRADLQRVRVPFSCPNLHGASSYLREELARENKDLQEASDGFVQPSLTTTLATEIIFVRFFNR